MRVQEIPRVARFSLSAPLTTPTKSRGLPPTFETRWARPARSSTTPPDGTAFRGTRTISLHEYNRLTLVARRRATDRPEPPPTRVTIDCEQLRPKIPREEKRSSRRSSCPCLSYPGDTFPPWASLGTRHASTSAPGSRRPGCRSGWWRTR